jgi:hypothetical protein
VVLGASLDAPIHPRRQVMPDSMGKRQRRDANQKKAVAREERRLARVARRRDRDAGLIEKGVPIGEAEQSEFLPDAEELAAMEKDIQSQP